MTDKTARLFHDRTGRLRQKVNVYVHSHLQIKNSIIRHFFHKSTVWTFEMAQAILRLFNTAHGRIQFGLLRCLPFQK